MKKITLIAIALFSVNFLFAFEKKDRNKVLLEKTNDFGVNNNNLLNPELNASTKLGGEEKGKKSAIKFNLMGLFIGQYQLAYEQAFGEKTSAQLAVGYITLPKSQTIGTNSYESTTSGIIVIPEFRYYFKEALNKFYVAPFGRIRSVTEKLTDTSNPIGTDVSFTEKKLSLGGGLVLGGQFLIADVLAVDVFIGPQYKSKTAERTYNNAGVTDADFESKFIDFKVTDKAGMGVRFGINLGVAF